MSANISRHSKAILIGSLCAILAGIFWGAVGTIVRVLTAFGLNNNTILFTRMSLTAAILFVVILIVDRSLLKFHLKDLVLFIMIGLFSATLLEYCYNEAINATSLSLAAVLLDLGPIYTVILARFIFHEKITSRKIISLVLAISGCILVSGLGTQNAVWTRHGIIFGVISGLLYAIYIILNKLATDKGYDSLTITFYCMLFSTMMLIPFTDFGSISPVIHHYGASSIIMLILNSLVCALFPYVLFSKSLSLIDAGRAGILEAIEPGAAMVLGIIFFREVPTRLMILGLIIVIAALVLMYIEPSADRGKS